MLSLSPRLCFFSTSYHQKLLYQSKETGYWFHVRGSNKSSRRWTIEVFRPINARSASHRLHDERNQFTICALLTWHICIFKLIRIRTEFRTNWATDELMLTTRNLVPPYINDAVRTQPCRRESVIPQTSALGGRAIVFQPGIDRRSDRMTWQQLAAVGRLYGVQERANSVTSVAAL